MVHSQHRVCTHVIAVLIPQMNIVSRMKILSGRQGQRPLLLVRAVNAATGPYTVLLAVGLPVELPLD